MWFGIFFGMMLMNQVGNLPSGVQVNAHRYVALGDSYTICEGASVVESWPVILTKHLNAAGVNIELIANPSRTGWTTRDLIDRELPVFDESGADFVTVCIGVNDWVRGIDKKEFQKNLKMILDHLQGKLPDKSRIILLTIPDFSVAPSGARYTGGRDATAGISAFNEVIMNEARVRKLKTVDLFEPSKAMQSDATLVAADGLHPSAKEYAIWEKLILPVAVSLLK